MPTFYRIVKTDPPTEADFRSMAAVGRRLRVDTPENRRLFAGVSVYNSLEAATRTANEYPKIGRFVAVLAIPEEGEIHWEQTTAEPSHYTLWGDPASLLAAVISVVAL
jgi:hypothetical protein